MRRLGGAAAALLLGACTHGPHEGAEHADFRAWTAPPPLGPPAAAPPDGACVDGEQTWALEKSRRRAALDAALRAEGAWLLPLTALPVPPEELARETTSIVRGPDGQRWMVVGQTTRCGEIHSEIGADASGRVFIVMGERAPGTVRELHPCRPSCPGVCGHPSPRNDLVAEVPPKARWSPPRTVTYTLEPEVRLLDTDAKGQRFDCLVP